MAMIIKTKRLNLVYILLGIIIAVSNAVLFLINRTAFPAIMVVVGVGFVFTGITNLRRLQQDDQRLD